MRLSSDSAIEEVVESGEVGDVIVEESTFDAIIFLACVRSALILVQ